MRHTLTRATRALAAIGLLLCAVSEASAQGEGLVDLLWSVPPGDVLVNDTFEMGLVARSGTLIPEPFSATEAILQWDPTRVRLLGINDAQDGYAWLASAFPPDPDGLNDTFLDGDALYQALGQFSPNPLPVASLTGLRVTTFVFRALGLGTTQINLPIDLGGFNETVVLDDLIPGLNILGTTTPGTVNIVIPEPTTAAFLLVLSSGFVFGRRGGLRRWWSGVTHGVTATGARS